MSVYKMFRSHYVKLNGPGPAPGPGEKENRPPLAPGLNALTSTLTSTGTGTDEHCDNLKLLLEDSNSKVLSLARTVKDLRRQLRERDATIASLTGYKPANQNKYSLEIHRLRPDLNGRAQNLVVDVSSDLQVHLKVEYLDDKVRTRSGPDGDPVPEPIIKVASRVVSKHKDAAEPNSRPRPLSAMAGFATTPGPGGSRGPPSRPGPIRKHGYTLDGGAGTGDGNRDWGSPVALGPLYSSLMWRTRQRAKETGYRFVWSRCGKILVKKNVYSPAMYILDETDLRKMV